MNAKSLSIRELLLNIFPQGTNREFADDTQHDGDPLKAAPRWAPDLFAAMAILIERSGCYTHPAFIQHSPSVIGRDMASAERHKLIEDTASGYRYCWRSGNQRRCSGSETSACNYGKTKCNEAVRTDAKCGWETAYGTIQERWGRLTDEHEYGAQEVGEWGALRKAEPPMWSLEAMTLFEIADHACEGVGFVSDLHNDASHSCLNPIAIHVCHNQQIAYEEEHKQREERVVDIKEIEGDFTYVRERLEKGVKRWREELARKTLTRLSYLPSSICYAVPAYFACVQPKANTPQVGYSVRSFSHNLALLPRVGEVSTYWFNAFGPPPSENRNRINLLLVPFPYFMAPQCFKPTIDDDHERFKFKVEQRWLNDLLTSAEEADYKAMIKAEHYDKRDPRSFSGSRAKLVEMQSQHLKRGIMELVRRAHDLKNAEDQFVSTLDGIILPELALSVEVAEQLSMLLFNEYSNLQFFISGVIADRVSAGTPPKIRKINSVFTRMRVNWPKFEENDEDSIELRRVQVKHHRWMLERSQILRYHLGAQLDPGCRWWEDNDMIERESLFWVFRPYMVMSSLVCEDLARIDPVQQVLRAVAPNLVIALLMDGPQTLKRWSCRYATVLSEDPGCGVLTLTSLGMIRHDSLAEPGPHKIALWKDSSGQTKELELPTGKAALAITLSVEKCRDATAGGRPRSEENWSRKLYLSASQPIGAPASKMFEGLSRHV